MGAGFLKYGETAAREVSGRIGGTLANATALRAIPAVGRSPGMVAMTLDDQKVWVFDAASTESAGAGVLVPADNPAAGRWLVGVTGSALALTSSTPADIGAAGTAAVGVGTTAARSDHVHELGSDVIVPDNIAEPIGSANNGYVGAPVLVRKAFTALTTGTADDVTVLNAIAPWAARIVDCWAVVTTAVGASTLTLRTAAAGGGSALSSALDSGTTGVKRNNATAATGTIAANGSLYLRRSDRAVAGEVYVLLLREPS